MKKRHLPVILSIAFLCVSVAIGHAQQTRETLTNADVIELVKMGLSEAAVVAKVRKSNCKCDTSTAALGRLKAAKVPDAVIVAMLDAGEASTSEAPKARESREEAPRPAVKAAVNSYDDAVLSGITTPGIFFYQEGRVVEMEPTRFSGTRSSTWLPSLTGGIVKAKVIARVQRASSNLQTQNRKPLFYFVFNPDYKDASGAMAGQMWGMPATSPADFTMVAMQKKTGSREAILAEYGAGGGQTGARDKDIREFGFEKIRPGVYRVVPTVDLAPGEYCFYFVGDVGGNFAGGKIFDFTVL